MIQVLLAALLSRFLTVSADAPPLYLQHGNERYYVPGLSPTPVIIPPTLPLVKSEGHSEYGVPNLNFQYEAPAVQPHSTYETPTQHPTYPVPQTQSAYEVPQPQPHSAYEVPQAQPQSAYEVPQPQPHSAYEVPQPQPHSAYEVPQPQPHSTYEVPQPQPLSTYEVPQPQPHSTYEVPQPQPHSTYEVPQPQPHSTYETPSIQANFVIPQEPHQEYQVPEEHFVAPAPPAIVAPYSGELASYAPEVATATEGPYPPAVEPYNAPSEDCPDMAVPYSQEKPYPAEESPYPAEESPYPAEETVSSYIAPAEPVFPDLPEVVASPVIYSAPYPPEVESSPPANHYGIPNHF